MDFELPPDPYAALGVPKNADAAAIKSTYRKLVLKCHPDKVQDESLKKQKQDEFHKIQTAYELVSDENKRAEYDAQVRLTELRKEKLERTGGTPSRSASYDYRSPTSAAAYGTHSAPRYEERKPTRAYDDDDKYFDDRSSSRKYDGAAYSKRPAPRPSRTEREPVRVSRTSEKVRSEHKKAKDRDERRDRSAKFSYVEEDESPDEKARYEREYRKRNEEARLREQQEAEDQRARRDAADARRKAEEERQEAAARAARRSTSRDREDHFTDERQRKLSDMENHVKNYISTSRNSDPRPSPGRTSSSRDARDYYDIRPRRPEAPRRSSARPRDREPVQPASSGRDGHRKGSSFPEIVEWDDDRKPPSFKHSVSSPADIKTVPRAAPQRAHTMESGQERRRDSSPSPAFRRSETMPSVRSSSRRKESMPTRPSALRNENMLPTESRHSSPENAYPSIPSAQPSSTSKKYYYASPGGGVTLAPEESSLPGGHRTVLREPETRRRQRSPSPLTTARAVQTPTTSSRYPAAPPRVVPVRIPPPPLGRSVTMSASPERRPSLDTGRGPSLYGELDSDYLRQRARNQTSFSPDKINWAKKYGPEHVEYSRGRDKERDYPKPGLRRTETYVY